MFRSSTAMPVDAVLPPVAPQPAHTPRHSAPCRLATASAAFEQLALPLFAVALQPRLLAQPQSSRGRRPRAGNHLQSSPRLRLLPVRHQLQSMDLPYPAQHLPHSRTGIAASRTVFLEDHPDLLDTADAGPTPEDNLIRLDNQAALHDALEQLQPPLREVLLLCDVEEIKYKDIALILDVPIGTVMSRISRARRSPPPTPAAATRGIPMNANAQTISNIRPTAQRLHRRRTSTPPSSRESSSTSPTATPAPCESSPPRNSRPPPLAPANASPHHLKLSPASPPSSIATTDEAEEARTRHRISTASRGRPRRGPCCWPSHFSDGVSSIKPTPSPPNSLDQHLATLSSGATPQVVSTDRHTVKPWFQGRLPFSFNLPEPERCRPTPPSKAPTSPTSTVSPPRCCSSPSTNTRSLFSSHNATAFRSSYPATGQDLRSTTRRRTIYI